MEKMEDESPKNKVKFLCSYGGKVLPRPSDGVLKYVGGETRVICIPRDATFADMMKKVSGVVDGEVVLKYQVIPEELDTLVSVRTEDDLKHMIMELDRHESSGSSLLRTFLFPVKPMIVDSPSKMQMQQPHPLPVEPYLLEQRYLDAINGIIRPSPSSKCAACSACSSPKSTSPDGCTTGESPFHYQGMQQLQKGMVSMQRVRSSPSLSSLTSSYNNTQPLQQQQQQQHNQGISRSRSSHYQHQHHPLVGGLRPIQEVGIGMGIGRLSPSQMSMNMMTDNMSSSSSSSRGMNYYYSNANRPHKAYAYHDDSGGHVVQSVPRSPRMYLGE